MESHLYLSSITEKIFWPENLIAIKVNKSENLIVINFGASRHQSEQIKVNKPEILIAIKIGASRHQSEQVRNLI